MWGGWEGGVVGVCDIRGEKRLLFCAEADRWGVVAALELVGCCKLLVQPCDRGYAPASSLRTRAWFPFRLLRCCFVGVVFLVLKRLEVPIVSAEGSYNFFVSFHNSSTSPREVVGASFFLETSYAFGSLCHMLS